MEKHVNTNTRSNFVKRGKAPEQSPLLKKLICIRRVSKVVKGGANFSFSALVAIGDSLGKIGLGSGKANEVSEAVRKASDKGTKNMVFFPLRHKRTIHHSILGCCGAAKVFMRSAPPGTGIRASKVARAVFEALGVQDVVAKSLGSNNPINVAKAIIDGLSSIQTPRYLRKKRGRDRIPGETIDSRGDEAETAIA
jgi:small subunit ribosomal protein S5